MSSRSMFIAVATVGAALLVPAAASAAAPYSPLDEHYLQTSIQGDRFEIQGGKLAMARGGRSQVKALGARLVKDHKKSLRESIALARQLGISVDSNPTPPQEWELSILRRVAVGPFDGWYAKLEVQDHKEDIDDSKEERSMGTNTAIRRLARQDLPELRAHWRLSRRALAASGG